MAVRSGRFSTGVCLKCAKVVEDVIDNLYCPDQHCKGIVVYIHAEDTPEGRSSVNTQVKDLVRDEQRRRDMEFVYSL
jgi:hypothetical protein